MLGFWIACQISVFYAHVVVEMYHRYTIYTIMLLSFVWLISQPPPRPHATLTDAHRCDPPVRWEYLD